MADDIGETFDALAQALRRCGIRDGPLRFPNATFVEVYQNLAATGVAYQSRTPKPQEKEGTIEVLTNIEYQAGWTVLQRFLSDERIAQLPQQEFTDTFLETLYAHKRQFAFFGTRQRAITELDAARIIGKAAYLPQKR